MRWPFVGACLLFACASFSIAMPRFACAAQASSSSASAPSPYPATGRKKKHHNGRGPTQKAPTPDRISEIQSALSRDGYYQGDPNGRWDANTVAAVEKFQSSHGIEGTGKLDAPTLQKLGLGSDIAGVSAPRPLASTSTGAGSPTSQSTSSPATATTAVNTSTTSSADAKVSPK
jgi:hypothetical protein